MGRCPMPHFFFLKEKEAKRTSTLYTKRNKRLSASKLPRETRKKNFNPLYEKKQEIKRKQTPERNKQKELQPFIRKETSD